MAQIEKHHFTTGERLLVLAAAGSGLAFALAVSGGPQTGVLDNGQVHPTPTPEPTSTPIVEQVPPITSPHIIFPAS